MSQDQSSSSSLENQPGLNASSSIRAAHVRNVRVTIKKFKEPMLTASNWRHQKSVYQWFSGDTTYVYNSVRLVGFSKTFIRGRANAELKLLAWMAFTNMDSPLAIVLLVVNLLAGVSEGRLKPMVSARPNENGRSTFNSTLESLEGNPTQDDAPPISARMTRQVNAVEKPEPGSLDPDTELAAKAMSKRISDGVWKIVEGALTLNLEKILRGSFHIPPIPEVRDRATIVLDSIFGNHTA